MSTPAIPTQMVSATGRSYGAGSGKLAEAKDHLKGSWMSPLQIILTAVVAAVLLGLVMYYTVAGLFETGNELHDIGWSSSGGGVLTILLVTLSIGAAAAAFGMGHKDNSSAIMFTTVTAAILGFVYYFVFASVKDNKKGQFAFWAFLAVALNIGVAFYGYWSLRSVYNDFKTNESTYEKDEKANIPIRYKWSMICSGISILLSLVVAGGLYQIHSHVTAV